MKRLAVLFLAGCCLAGDLDVMFWNVENFFDIEDTPNKRDGDYMPGSVKHYTYRAYALKTQHLADVINHIAPDVLAMAEVENRRVLRDLKKHLYHRDAWEILIDDGPDIRGIDPALMYRGDRLGYLEHRYYPVFIEDRGYHSRPLMRADLVIRESGDTLSVFVAHWPSRRGGKAATDAYRMQAAGILLQAYRDLRERHPRYTVLITGDFNDERGDSCLHILSSQPGIDYLAASLPKGVSGTYYYNGKWSHFDHFLLSLPADPGFSVRRAAVRAPSWIREKGTHAPLRFYNGVECSGGYSDHYPLSLKLRLKRKSVE
jgi:hypothetical protein